MNSKKHFRFKAFTLIEVSVITLIIGIFIAGVFIADGMISKFRITAAKNLTRSSPINTISRSALWLETSLESSFNSDEEQNGSSLSTWYDQRNAADKVVITTAGSSPTYSNTINRIHAVEFDGSPNKHFTFDGSFLNNTDYTIFVLEKRQDPKGDNYFLGEVGSGLNNSLTLGYSADNQIIHAQGTNSYPAGISTYSNSKDKPRVFAFIHSAANGNQTYVNGVLAAENTDPAAQAHLTAIDTVAIGKGYIGEIGELAIFTKALSATDRTSIEDYLGKKWTSSINRAKSPNCIGGLVTIGGCDNSSPVTCSASGTGYSKTGLTYTSGSSFACNLSGFAGTIGYKCLASGPASNITGSCTATICSAPAGTGYLAQTGLPYAESGAGTFACDTASGFVGALNYTCTASGLATNITGSCGCDSANGYSLVGGVCSKQCSVSVFGSTITTVSAGTTQVACNVSGGYATTPFTFPACDSSAITGNCGCATGYSWSSGTSSCEPITCSITSVTGLNNKANLAYTQTETPIPNTPTSACATGYDGSPTYTCSSGSATIMNPCLPITCTAPASTGYLDQSGLAYTESATFPCDAYYYGTAVYQGTKTYTCTSRGLATITGGTCYIPPLDCTGGSITTSDGNKIHTFTTSGTFSCTAGYKAGIVKYLGVGPGGSGGSGTLRNISGVQHRRSGGGGGGGQVVYVSNASLGAGDSYSIVVISSITSVNKLSGTISTSSFAKGGNGGAGLSSTLTTGSGGNGASSSGGGGGGGGVGPTGGGSGGSGSPAGGNGGSGSSGKGGNSGNTNGYSYSISGSDAIYGNGGFGGGVSFSARPTYIGAGGNGGDASSGTISVNGGSATLNPSPSGGGVFIFSYPTN